MSGADTSVNRVFATNSDIRFLTPACHSFNLTYLQRVQVFLMISMIAIGIAMFSELCDEGLPLTYFVQGLGELFLLNYILLGWSYVTVSLSGNLQRIGL